MEEKRKHPRVDAQNLVFFEQFDEEGITTLGAMGKTLDLSQGGILLETYVRLAVASHLHLTLQIKGVIIKVKGRVVYLKEVAPKNIRIGIQFLDLKDEDQQTISRYVESKM